MVEKFNIKQIASTLTEPNARVPVGSLGPFKVWAVRCEGEFPFHTDEEDELFFVLDGQIRIDFRDGSQTINPGEGILLHRGVFHNTVAPATALVLMVDTDEEMTEQGERV